MLISLRMRRSNRGGTLKGDAFESSPFFRFLLSGLVVVRLCRNKFWCNVCCRCYEFVACVRDRKVILWPFMSSRQSRPLGSTTWPAIQGEFSQMGRWGGGRGKLVHYGEVAVHVE